MFNTTVISLEGKESCFIGYLKERKCLFLLNSFTVISFADKDEYKKRQGTNAQIMGKRTCTFKKSLSALSRKLLRSFDTF